MDLKWTMAYLFTLVFPTPLIMPIRQETVHSLHLESVSLKCTRKDAMIAAIETLVLWTSTAATEV